MATTKLEVLKITSDDPVWLSYRSDTALTLSVHQDAIVTENENLLIVQRGGDEQRGGTPFMTNDMIVYYATLCLLSIIERSFLFCMLVMFVADLSWYPK